MDNKLVNPMHLTDLRDALGLNESVLMNDYNVFTEAVFSKGHEKVAPLEDTIAKLKQELTDQINKQHRDAKSGGSKFDPKAFWRHQLWKDFEDHLVKIFGFRNVTINPVQEKYHASIDEFETRSLNAFVYRNNRFPIEGLLTDEGFYDKSRSVQMDVYMTLGLLRALEPDEVVAVLLHEFGHGIDPALVDIKYTGATTLAKYMSDRNMEKPKVQQNKESSPISDLLWSFIVLFPPALVLALLGSAIVGIYHRLTNTVKKRLEKMRKDIENDKRFTKKDYAEAYADNFARMYGYGPALLRGLKKMDKDYDDYIKSRWSKEKERQKVVLEIAEDALKDEHKTDIHRARALINEYKEDLKDPNIPKAVKKQIEEDMHEIEKLLDSYMNDFSDMQNKINKLINEELEKLDNDSSSDDKASEKKEDNKSEDKKEEKPEKSEK